MTTLLTVLASALAGDLLAIALGARTAAKLTTATRAAGLAREVLTAARSPNRTITPEQALDFETWLNTALDQ